MSVFLDLYFYIYFYIDLPISAHKIYLRSWWWQQLTWHEKFEGSKPQKSKKSFLS